MKNEDIETNNYNLAKMTSSWRDNLNMKEENKINWLEDNKNNMYICSIDPATVGKDITIECHYYYNGKIIKTIKKTFMETESDKSDKDDKNQIPS